MSYHTGRMWQDVLKAVSVTLLIVLVSLLLFLAIIKGADCIFNSEENEYPNSNAFISGYTYNVELIRPDKIYREVDTLQIVSNIRYVLDNSTSYTEILSAVKALRNVAEPFDFTPLDVREVVFMNRINTHIDYIKKASAEFDIPVSLIKAIIYVESNGNKKAQSHRGAKGLMQLMDVTAIEVGVVDVWDPAQNIMGGTFYLRRMLDRYGGNLSLALAAYNAGPEAVRRFGGIPPYRETQNYVRSVMSMKHYIDGLEKPTLFTYVSVNMTGELR